MSTWQSKDSNPSLMDPSSWPMVLSSTPKKLTIQQVSRCSAAPEQSGWVSSSWLATYPRERVSTYPTPPGPTMWTLLETLTSPRKSTGTSTPPPRESTSMRSWRILRQCLLDQLYYFMHVHITQLVLLLIYIYLINRLWPYFWSMEVG